MTFKKSHETVETYIAGEVYHLDRVMWLPGNVINDYFRKPISKEEDRLYPYKGDDAGEPYEMSDHEVCVGTFKIKIIIYK